MSSLARQKNSCKPCERPSRKSLNRVKPSAAGRSWNHYRLEMPNEWRPSFAQADPSRIDNSHTAKFMTNRKTNTRNEVGPLEHSGSASTVPRVGEESRPECSGEKRSGVGGVQGEHSAPFDGAQDHLLARTPLRRRHLPENPHQRQSSLQ